MARKGESSNAQEGMLGMGLRHQLLAKEKSPSSIDRQQQRGGSPRNPARDSRPGSQSSSVVYHSMEETGEGAVRVMRRWGQDRFRIDGLTNATVNVRWMAREALCLTSACSVSKAVIYYCIIRRGPLGETTRCVVSSCNAARSGVTAGSSGSPPWTTNSLRQGTPALPPQQKAKRPIDHEWASSCDLSWPTKPTPY